MTRFGRGRLGRSTAALFAAVVLAIVVAACGGDDSGSAASTTVAGGASSTTAAAAGGKAFAYGGGACPGADAAQSKKFSAAPKQCIDAAKTYTATFDTTAGQVVVTLDTKRTPGTTNNFVVLARYKYFDNSLFFRTDPSIGIIQGGGATNTEDPGYSIPDEGGKFAYTPGDLVMARTGAPNSGGAQFFFAVDANTAKLNGQGTYVTFGKVTAGLDVLVKVLASHKAEAGNPLGGSPNPAVTVRSIRITES